MDKFRTSDWIKSMGDKVAQSFAVPQSMLMGYGNTVTSGLAMLGESQASALRRIQSSLAMVDLKVATQALAETVKREAITSPLAFLGVVEKLHYRLDVRGLLTHNPPARCPHSLTVPLASCQDDCADLPEHAHHGRFCFDCLHIVRCFDE